MGFSLFDICRSVLLVLNAMAILSERRFLRKHGIAPPGASGSAGGGVDSPAAPAFGDFGAVFGGPGALKPAGDDSASVKGQIGQLLFSVRLLLSWPIVIAIVVMVVLTIIFG